MVKFLNETIRVENKFNDFANNYFFTNELKGFDSKTGEGLLAWESYVRKTRFSFNQVETPFAKTENLWQFPDAYSTSPETPFRISFISSNSFRIIVNTRENGNSENTSLMIDELKEKSPEDYGWEVIDDGSSIEYLNSRGKIIISRNPWSIEIVNNEGKRIVKTQTTHDNISLKNDQPQPFSFVDCPSDKSRHISASFTLSPNEKIYGTGESFTRLNKRGQLIHLYTRDAHGALTKDMYKPIPFYLSSNGYGMFTHTSSPTTFDIGNKFDDTQTIYTYDEHLDLFFFLGNPKEVLTEYTNLTGKSPMLPLWSFGLWMSRISYFSESEVREVSKKLRKYKIPTDVIHIDTGWFEEDWKCNYKFSETRFDNAPKMISDLNDEGFKVSLWQIPYFTPENELFQELVDSNLAVKKIDGGLPTEDAVLDFTNPETVKWYQDKLSNLLEQGVAAIKADFGEGAPLQGIYSNGKSGIQEHNMYPLRYNKAVADITKEVTGDSIIWARSAWAGSQRYPLHWGGDAEISDNGMAASLRAGLSLGMSGFTFWSHDLGGFTRKSPRELYNRWLGFGVFTSHLRAHGQPPKEPWEYDEAFVENYRNMLNLRYELMPYIYSESLKSSEMGWPMIRAMLLEYPNDPTCWHIEDQYLFGSDLLIAPIIEEGKEREVYLPEGVWFNFITEEKYTGGKWYTLKYNELPVLAFVKEGTIIPTIEPALSTKFLNWNELGLEVFGELKPEMIKLNIPDDKEIEISITEDQRVLSKNISEDKIKTIN